MFHLFRFSGQFAQIVSKSDGLNVVVALFSLIERFVEAVGSYFIIFNILESLSLSHFFKKFAILFAFLHSDFMYFFGSATT